VPPAPQLGPVARLDRRPRSSRGSAAARTRSRNVARTGARRGTGRRTISWPERPIAEVGERRCSSEPRAAAVRGRDPRLPLLTAASRSGGRNRAMEATKAIGRASGRARADRSRRWSKPFDARGRGGRASASSGSAAGRRRGPVAGRRAAGERRAAPSGGTAAPKVRWPQPRTGTRSRSYSAPGVSGSDSQSWAEVDRASPASDRLSADPRRATSGWCRLEERPPGDLDGLRGGVGREARARRRATGRRPGSACGRGGHRRPPCYRPPKWDDARTGRVVHSSRFGTGDGMDGGTRFLLLSLQDDATGCGAGLQGLLFPAGRAAARKAGARPVRGQDAGEK
jgi:hypothetical protein